MSQTYVGRHRLIKRQNFTLRATVAATVALIAMILIAMSSATDAAGEAPLADAVAHWQATVQQTALAPTEGAQAGADSGKKVTTASAVRKDTAFLIKTCNAEE